MKAHITYEMSHMNQNHKLSLLLLELEDPGPLAPRSFKVTPTAPMGGGTQLFEGAHLTGGIRAFVVNQANVLITSFLLV